MMCMKDQQTGLLIRRVDRERMNSWGTKTKITVTHKKIFPMMNNNIKRNVTSVRAIGKEDLEGIEIINNNKIQIQWVMKTMVVAWPRELMDKNPIESSWITTETKTK